MNPEELEKALEEVLRELSEEEAEPDSETETEEEVVEEDNYRSDSEQSADELDNLFTQSKNEEGQHEEDDYRFFIGKDEDTLWISKPLYSGKAMAKNIITVLPGPRATAKHTQKEIDAFNLFITDSMIDDITTNSNIYIQKKRM